MATDSTTEISDPRCGIPFEVKVGMYYFLIYE